ADALAAGPVTGGWAPVLLVKNDSIPAATAVELTRLRPDRIVILGGVAAIGPIVAAAAGNYTDGEVTRVGGANRYETAAQLSASHFAPDVDEVYLATGANYADALAAAPLGTPILLVQQDCIPRSTFTELARLSAGSIVVLGGSNAVSDRVRRLIACSS
ncbi:MAG: cell wall-binding repeat-containing protein, partial [Actinomycetota bacterium]